MAAIPNPTLGGYFDDALFDSFGYGFDVDIRTYLTLSPVKRFEQGTSPGFRRSEVSRFEQATAGAFKRVDD